MNPILNILQNIINISDNSYIIQSGTNNFVKKSLIGNVWKVPPNKEEQTNFGMLAVPALRSTVVGLLARYPDDGLRLLSHIY